MAQNLFVMRHANMFLAPVWNRTCISNVQITFKVRTPAAGCNQLTRRLTDLSLTHSLTHSFCVSVCC